jgi:hypothetical protein
MEAKNARNDFKKMPGKIKQPMEKQAAAGKSEGQNQPI